MRRLKFEYLENKDNKDLVAYRILFGKEILAALHFNKDKFSLKDLIDKKIKFIEQFCKDYPDIPRKKAIMKFSHIDDTMIPYYKSQFPHGGKRDGVGRPVGSKRTAKTERINFAVTPDEKTYLKKCLKEYRAKNY